MLRRELTVDWLPEDGISRCRKASQQKSVGDLLNTAWCTNFVKKVTLHQCLSASSKEVQLSGKLWRKTVTWRTAAYAAVVRYQAARLVASLQSVKTILGANPSPSVSTIRGSYNTLSTVKGSYNTLSTAKGSYNTLDTWRRKFPFRACGRHLDYIT